MLRAIYIAVTIETAVHWVPEPVASHAIPPLFVDHSFVEMASELKKQVALLQKLKVQPETVLSGKASLFLSKKEAGNVDTTTVLEAALTGIKALCQYDDRFSWCLDTLFHPSSVDFQRELKTKEVRV